MEITQDDLLKKLNITKDSLHEWLENGLITYNPGISHLFQEQAIEEGNLIKQFLTLGYSLKEIKQIKRNVGLPLKDENGRYISKDGLLSIGELSEKTGINPRTIKFWEEKSIINPFRRTEGGFRLYRKKDIQLVHFVKDLQTFNYTLSEIGEILKIVGFDLGEGEGDLLGMEPEHLEKIYSGLEYLIERMRETREASSRVETIFNRRLRVVSRMLKVGKK